MFMEMHLQNIIMIDIHINHQLVVISKNKLEAIFTLVNIVILRNVRQIQYIENVSVK